MIFKTPLVTFEPQKLYHATRWRGGASKRREVGGRGLDLCVISHFLKEIYIEENKKKQKISYKK